MCLGLHPKYTKEYSIKEKHLRKQMHKNFPELYWVILRTIKCGFIVIMLIQVYLCRLATFNQNK